MSAVRWIKVFIASLIVFTSAGWCEETDTILERGNNIFIAASCITCHTDIENNGSPLAGGREVETPFGSFYTPNITPDRETGIGKWTDEDFVRALREGIAPDGTHYFPAFPYTSYTKMAWDDMLALKAYLMSLQPVRQQNRPHEITGIYSSRPLVGFWKRFNFQQGEYTPNRNKSPLWNRGAYLTQALAHCGECHTPRNPDGGSVQNRFLAGTMVGPKGNKIPNITSDKKDGIGKWSKQQLMAFLIAGITPNQHMVQGGMAEVVSSNTSKLSAYDLKAMTEYLLAVPPLPTIDDSIPTRADWGLSPLQDR